MINSANHYSISDILKSDSDVKYITPKYQREYIWGRNDWENLFDDIWYNDSGHFLGSIICINRSDDALRIQELEIVDGQQRLITLSLFYAAIYRWLNDQSDLSEELRHELYNLKHRLVLKSNNSRIKVSPSYQRQNYEDYCAALKEAGIIEETNVPRNAGNRRIYKTFNYFLNRLRETFELSNVQRLLDKVSQACVVKIEVSTHSDAFTLFESLNNRGVPLSAMDLIKNKLLAVLEKNKVGNIDDNFRKWNRLLDNLSEDYSIQERYLRQYYNAFKFQKDVSVPGITLATRSNIIQIYEKLIDKNAEKIFKDLYDKSELYNQLINLNGDTYPPGIASSLHDLDRIGGAASYTLLLYLRAYHKDEPIMEVVELLVKYFVRRNLTDVPPTRDLARLFMNLIENLQNNRDEPILTTVHHFLTQPGRIASDDIFRSKLEGDIYDENVGVTRFILCKFEEVNQTRETLTNLWERDDKKRFIWTVEHIFPQGSNIPDSWVSMMADGNHEKAQEYRDEYVHKLGNLTITGYNSKLGNKSFVDKRDRKDSKGKFVGYKNGLFLNRTLKDKESWQINDIEQRTMEMVSTAMELFKLE